jgi:hypothetical protein
LYTLSILAPKAPETVKALRAGEKDKDSSVRIVAAGAMGHVTAEAEEAAGEALVAMEWYASIPAPEYNWLIVKALARFGPAAKDAIPTLIALRNEAREPDRSTLKRLILRIDPNAAVD